MKVGDKVHDMLFTGAACRGNGVIEEITKLPGNGDFYAVIVRWNDEIPDNCPFPGFDDGTSEEYYDDLGVGWK